jgi:hypothetical protein
MMNYAFRRDLRSDRRRCVTNARVLHQGRMECISQDSQVLDFSRVNLAVPRRQRYL